jgi:surface protein
MYALFYYSNFNQAIGNWDVSNVYTMHSMFLGTPFNQNINNWDVSNVIIMESMFASTKFFNQDISNWDVSKVANMYYMFSYSKFNQNINNWNVGKVNDMQGIFNSASFNQPLNNWDVSNVKKMARMFRNAIDFDQDISFWNLESIETCAQMFEGVTLSNANYEALLIGWNNQDLNQNIVFDGGNSTYTSNEAETAKQNMIDNDNWTITDGGKSAPLNINIIAVSAIKIYKSDNSTLHIDGVSNGLLNVYSITGKNVIKNYKINTKKQTVQLPKITSGVYFLKINFEGKEYVQKILF